MAPALDTKHLRLLVALDEAGSLTRAARRLNLTPSALSQQLRELEQRMGGALFDRHHGRLGANAAGRLLTDAARDVLGRLSSAEDAAREMLGGTSGVLRVGAAWYGAYDAVTLLLRSFAEAWPAVAVRLVGEAMSNPCGWVAERRLDVAIVAADASNDRRVRLTPLFDDELVALVGPDHPWCARDAVGPDEFASQHVWGDAATLGRDAPFFRALAAGGRVSPRRTSVVPSGIGVPVEMARAHLGVAILPLRAAISRTADGRLSAVRIGQGVSVPWSAVTRAAETEPMVDAFVALLQRHVPDAPCL